MGTMFKFFIAPLVSLAALLAVTYAPPAVAIPKRNCEFMLQTVVDPRIDRLFAESPDQELTLVATLREGKLSPTFLSGRMLSFLLHLEAEQRRQIKKANLRKPLLDLWREDNNVPESPAGLAELLQRDQVDLTLNATQWQSLQPYLGLFSSVFLINPKILRQLQE